MPAAEVRVSKRRTRADRAKLFPKCAGRQAFAIATPNAGSAKPAGVFSRLIYATAVADFFYRLRVLFASATVTFKISRRRNPARRIVRRLKVCGFRVVNHARSIAELISVPLTDDHLDL